MNNTLSKVFIFAVGAAIGSVTTWKFVETKYKKIANEEIASVKETFSRGHRIEVKPVDEVANVEEDKEYTPTEEDLAKLKDTIATNGYRDYSTKKEKKEDVDVDTPYVISPEEFDENDDYDTVSLTYYSDGVLADEQGNIIEDVDSLVGKDSLNHFGEYEDDSVFVRNDRLMTDYEILADTQRYVDIYR